MAADPARDASSGPGQGRGALNGRWSTVALVAAGLLGLLGVAAGAFGAHGLRGRVSPPDLEIWRTAAHYQQLHAVVLAALAMRGPKLLAAASRFAVPLFVIGVVVFSGTLYAMVLGGPRVLGAITPVGGLCLMAGWLALAVEGITCLRHRPTGQADQGDRG